MEVLIVHGIDPYNTKPGGTRSYILNLIDFLINRKIKVTLMGISSHEQHIDINYNFIKVKGAYKDSSIKFLFALFIKSFFLKYQKNCIIVTNRSDNMLPFILFHINSPKVCILHGVDAKKIKMRKGKIIGMIYDLIEHISLKYTQVIIAVDTRTYDFYINRYPWLKSKMKIIPIGINLKQFKPLDKNECRSKYSFSEEDNIIMYVGRLEKEKNIEFIVSSLKYLSHSYKFVIVGDGAHKNSLIKLASSLKINYFFTGIIQQDKMPEILNCADVLVISSFFESGPLVAQESIACGVPVVSVDVGRVKEFVVDDNIGLICNRNLNEFAGAIDKMLDKKDKNFIAYRRTIVEKFSFENTAITTFELFETLINDKKEEFDNV